MLGNYINYDSTNAGTMKPHWLNTIEACVLLT